MTNFDVGWAIITLAIWFGSLIISPVELEFVYTFLKKTREHRNRIALLAVLLIIGYLVSLQTNAAFIASASLVLIMPMTVLIPAIAFPALTHWENNFNRVVAAYVVDLLLGIGLVLAFFGSGITPKIEPPWQDPVSNTITFASLLILYAFVALFVFWLMSVFRRAHETADSKLE